MEKIIIRIKISLKVNKSDPNIPSAHVTLNLDNSSKKSKFKSLFYFELYAGRAFSMIPLTFLYDEYIDRPKLSEQKKPVEYIVPPPTGAVGTMRVFLE